MDRNAASVSFLRQWLWLGLGTVMYDMGLGKEGGHRRGGGGGEHKHETWVPTLQKSAVNNPKLEGAHLHPLVSGGLPLI